VALTKISETVADGSATTVNFTGIDSTYKIYLFRFIGIRSGGTDHPGFLFNGSTDGGSSYNIQKTSGYWRAYNNANSSDNAVAILASGCLDPTADAGTVYQRVLGGIADSGGNGSGSLIIFNPSQTTYDKYWISKCITVQDAANLYAIQSETAGYFMTTSAINAVSFKVDAGNVAGTIQMWGL